MNTAVPNVDLSTRQKWMALIPLLIATYMAVLDTFIVNIASPTLEVALYMSSIELQAVFIGYLVPYGGMLILGGRLGGNWGFKKLFLISLIGFAVASLVCAVAPTTAYLIWGRIMQGLAAGILLPQALSLIRILFTEPKEQVLAFSFFSSTIGLGIVTGQVVGGAIMSMSESNDAWRGIFLINLPVALLAFL